MRGGQLTSINVKGFAALMLTAVVLVSVTLFAFVSAQTVVSRQHNVVSYHQEKNAFNTAQAGLDYAIPYLTKNYDTIVDGSSVQVNMGNQNSATIQFNFQGDKNLIRITSIGHTSNNNTSTLKQLVKYQSANSSKTLSLPAMARNNLAMSGASEIVGNGTDLVSAKVGSANANAVSITQYASTRLGGTNTKVSTPAGLGADIIFDPGLFSGKTNPQIETELLGKTIDQLSSVTTQTAQTVKLGMVGVTQSSDTTGGSTAPILQISPTFFNAYASNKSVTLNSATNLALGSSSSPVKIGAQGSPKSIEINLSGTKTSTFTPTVKIAPGSVIYGDIIIHTGNLILDPGAKISGNVIMQNGNLTIKQVSSTTLDGSATVLGNVIANGNVDMALGAKVFGLVYANGNITMTLGQAMPANMTVIWGAAYAGNIINLSSYSTISYNPTYAKMSTTTTTTGGGASGYAKVPGSWTDS